MRPNESISWRRTNLHAQTHRGARARATLSQGPNQRQINLSIVTTTTTTTMSLAKTPARQSSHLGPFALQLAICCQPGELARAGRQAGALLGPQAKKWRQLCAPLIWLAPSRRPARLIGVHIKLRPAAGPRWASVSPAGAPYVCAMAARRPEIWAPAGASSQDANLIYKLKEVVAPHLGAAKIASWPSAHLSRRVY